MLVSPGVLSSCSPQPEQIRGPPDRGGLRGRNGIVKGRLDLPTTPAGGRTGDLVATLQYRTRGTYWVGCESACFTFCFTLLGQVGPS